MYALHLFILYASYLSIPFLFFLVFLMIKRTKKITKSKIELIAFIILMLLTLSFIYARFIEPNIILTRTTQIETGFQAKIVVIADMHIGVYKDIAFLQRVANKINEISDVDAVLIAGDLTYYSPEDTEGLTEMFSPLKDIKVPTYAVLGNHDEEMPGPPIQKELILALKGNNISYLENTSAKTAKFTVLGLGDKDANKDDISKINDFSDKDNLIVLTHNPDTTLRYTNSIPDLTISGHTHGGQNRIPFLYKKLIPCNGDFDEGLYNTKTGKLFITGGLGEVGLPMRLGIPPTIEILELN